MRQPALLAAARRLRNPPLAWLLTDPRAGDPAALLERLPRAVGLIIRDYELADRASHAARLVRVARRQRRRVLIAGDERLALRLGANGVHWPEALARYRPRPKKRWIVSVAAHGRTGLVRARRAKADQALLSPLFPTRSHAGAAGLGPLRAGLAGQRCRIPLIALGGITATTARRLRPGQFSGLAAIDGWQCLDAMQHELKVAALGIQAAGPG